eukprot:TRINITY_DN6173_c0_g1_i2.p1 TRINITY_DN6173_c0_g1~~TRINITY_DN6173_c0_g1_i2.p1  ORF type:complete len:241 (-),score=57.49 TRINITY_DN6173_c0_g1_i2:95-817(-)
MGSIYANLTRSYKNFAEQYNKWHEKTSGSLNISNHFEINSQYKTLLSAATERKEVTSLKKFQADYNKYVDDLLKLAPQKQTYPNISMKELKEGNNVAKEEQKGEHIKQTTTIPTPNINVFLPASKPINFFSAQYSGHDLQQSHSQEKNLDYNPDRLFLHSQENIDMHTSMNSDLQRFEAFNKLLESFCTPVKIDSLAVLGDITGSLQLSQPFKLAESQGHSQQKVDDKKNTEKVNNFLFR